MRLDSGLGHANNTPRSLEVLLETSNNQRRSLFENLVGHGRGLVLGETTAREQMLEGGAYMGP